MRKKRNNKPDGQLKDHNQMVHNVPKDPMGCQYKKDEFEDKLEKLQDETQGYIYSQSSKFSSIARNLTFGILGTIWVLTYSEGKCTIPNNWLLGALILSLVYLVADVCHYFSDTISYHNELNAMDNYRTMLDINEKHEPFMDKISQRSYQFLWAKFIILAFACVLFLIGMWVIYHPITNN